MVEQAAHCELCESPGGEVVWQDPLCRVVRVADPDYPGFCRVIWGRHVAEMTDLPAADRRHLLAVVFAVEASVRMLWRPDKVNLASLGNLVPHLHWHVIPRFADDRHFPQPIWAKASRPSSPSRPRVETRRLHDAIVQALAEEQGGTAG
jgi:diadenosine tetraphosphate (Ap4A) HIT family hydrolase